MAAIHDVDSNSVRPVFNLRKNLKQKLHLCYFFQDEVRTGKIKMRGSTTQQLVLTTLIQVRITDDMRI
jgi:hypothetical protein